MNAPQEPESEANEEVEEMEQKNEDESGLYQHVREAEKGTAETVDAATQVLNFH